MIQAHIYYTGVVQGVGFRYTVHRMASNLSINGWVRNVRDGRVEIMVEAPEETVKKLCQDIEARFEGNIRDKTIAYHPWQGEFKGFKIIDSV